MQLAEFATSTCTLRAFPPLSAIGLCDPFGGSAVDISHNHCAALFSYALTISPSDAIAAACDHNNLLVH